MKFTTKRTILTLSNQCGGAGPASLVCIDTGFIQIFGFNIQDFFQTFFHNNNYSFSKLEVIE